MPKSFRFFLLGILTLGLTGELLSACQKDTDAVPANVQAVLVGTTWLNSHEEESTDNSARTFRPDTYVFPPSRGRAGYRFDANGKLTYYSIARADGMLTHSGSWKALDNNTFKIALADGYEAAYTVQVVSLQDNVLRLQRLP